MTGFSRRKRRRRDSHPCVLCGQMTYDWDHICTRCRRDVKAGREYCLLKDSDDGPITISVARNWNFGHYTGIAKNSNASREIKEAVLILIEATKGGYKPNASLGYIKGLHNELGDEYIAKVTEEKLQAASNLLQAIRDISARSYKEGLRRGKSFVKDLIDGNMTINDMERNW